MSKGSKLYCLSGLGTDQRAFRNFKLEDIELIHIPWIDFLENETLESYSKRLYDTVNPEDNYNLIGLSFGGMIAQEWGKIKAPNKLFLLSTISDKRELPGYIKVATKLKLHKIVPTSILSSPNFIAYYIFGITNNENKKTFQYILRDVDHTHLKWAMNSILTWSNDSVSKEIRIHGDNDKLLPLPDKVDYIIKGGGHMIVLNDAIEISSIIQKEMNS